MTTLVAKGTITGNPPLPQIQTAQNHSGDGRKLHLSKLLSPENLWIKILPDFHYIQMNRFDFMTCFLSTKIRLLWGAVNPCEASFGPWGHIFSRWKSRSLEKRKLQQNHLIRKNTGHLAQINSGTVRVSFYCMFQVFFSQQFLHEMMSPASPRCFGMLQHILIVQLPPNFPGRVANTHPRIFSDCFNRLGALVLDDFGDAIQPSHRHRTTIQRTLQLVYFSFFSFSFHGDTKGETKTQRLWLNFWCSLHSEGCHMLHCSFGISYDVD